MLGDSFNMGDIPLETLEEGIIVRINKRSNEQEGERQIIVEHSEDGLQCKSTSSINHSDACDDDSDNPTSMPLTARPHDTSDFGDHHDGDDEGGRNAVTGQKIAFAVESRRGSSVLPFLAYTSNDDQKQERLRRQQLEQDHLKPDSMIREDWIQGGPPPAPGAISAPQSFQNALLPPHVPSQTPTGILAEEANSFSPSPLALRAVSPSTRETEETNNENEAYEAENKDRERQLLGLGVRAPITDAFSKPQVTLGIPQTAFAGHQQAPSTFSHPSSRITKQVGVVHHWVTGPSSMTEGRHQDLQQQQPPLLPFTRVTREIRKVTAKTVVAAAAPAKGAASTVFEVWPDDSNRIASGEPLSFGTVGEDQSSSPSFERAERGHLLNSLNSLNYSSNSMNNNTVNIISNKALFTSARESNDDKDIGSAQHTTLLNHTHPSERRTEISVAELGGRKLPVAAAAAAAVAADPLLLSLHHPHLVSLSGMEKAEEEDMAMIIAEHTTGGFVGGGVGSASSVTLSLPQPAEVVAKYTFALVSALSFLHHRGVVHRGVKAANITLRDGVVKLALIDNRSCLNREDDEEETLPSTSLNWLPPEVITQNKQQQQQQQQQQHEHHHDNGDDEHRTHSAFSSAGFSAVDVSVDEDNVASAARSRSGRGSDRWDIWSLGCTVIEMLTGLKPFEEEARLSGQSLEHFIEHLEDPVPLPKSIITSVDENAADFIRRCLRPNPNDRLSAEALLHHRFISKYFAQTEATGAYMYYPSDLMGSDRERRDSYASVFTALTQKGSECDVVLRRLNSSRMSSHASQHAAPHFYNGIFDGSRHSKPTAFPPIPVLIESRRESQNPMLSSREITSRGEAAIARPPSAALSQYSNCFFHFEKKRTAVLGPRGLEEVSTVGETPLPLGSSCSRIGHSPQLHDGNNDSVNSNNQHNVTNRNSLPLTEQGGGRGARGRGKGLLPFVTATSPLAPQHNADDADPLTDLAESARSIPVRREASGSSPSEVHVPPNPLVPPSRLEGEQRGGEWSGVAATQQHHEVDVFANEEQTKAAVVTMHEPQSRSGSDAQLIVRNQKHAVFRLASCVKREWVSVVVGALIVSLVAATIALLVITL